MNKNKIPKRLTAFLLSAVLLCSAIIPAFAWSEQEGIKCGSKIGAQYLSSDGRNYMDVGVDHYYLKYNSDGSTSFEFNEGRYKVRRKLLIYEQGKPEDTHWAYCIEAGVTFDNSSSGYTSGNAVNSRFFSTLPAAARNGIMMVAMYGYQEGKAIPISGLNADDAFFAGQILIWEYQQGIRTDAGARKDNGPVKASLYYDLLKGRPAEKMYDYLLEKIRMHSVIPSFAAKEQKNAPQIILEYNSNTEKYSKTITDTNQSNIDLLNLSGLGITVTRSGNNYTFTSNHMIDESVSVMLRKNIPIVGGRFLVWGRPGYQTVCTGADDPITFYLNVKTESFGSMKLKKVSEDGKVSGISFRITGSGVDKTVTTNSAGEIQVDELRAGVYTVTERTGAQYVPQKSQQVTIVPGRTSTVTFNNVLKRGSLTVTKTSEDGLKQGVRFRLSGRSDCGLTVDEYAVTDNSGKAYFRDVLIGTGYTLEEIDTGIQYVILPKQTAAVKWNEVTNASFNNILKKWRATVTKADGETITPQGDASLSGAVYGVYKGNQLIDTYTTDGRGQFVTEWYTCGNDWTIREITPSEGYLLDPTVHKAGAEPGHFTIERNEIGLDVTEQAVKGKVSIIKHNDDGSTGIDTPEVGAEFEVFLKASGSYEAAKESERDMLICDENGYAESKLLPYGRYTVHQTKGWEGRELMKDFDVFVSENGKMYRYLINNATFRALIRIEKRDAETGKVIPVSGFGFQIRNTDTGELVVQHINYPTPTELDTFYTDSTGMLMLPEALDYGSYELLEVCTGGEGYVLSADPVPFTVDGTEAVVTVTKHNMAQKGQILIHKTGEVFSSVIEENGRYQPLYSMQGLNGTVYDITAAEDIITPDGTIRYKKGTVVDTITTRGGYAESRPLYLGRYFVTEKTASHGMVRNPEPNEVVLKYAGETVEITVSETAFVNERQKVKIKLQKNLEQDGIFGIGMNGEIRNVSFGLYAAEDITAADGKCIPKDGLIEVAFADENGQICFASDLPLGRYYLQEYTTDNHYQISKRRYPVVFEYAGQDVAVVEIAVNNGDPIANKLIRGNIYGKKLDEDGFSIAGAVFGLFAKDETDFTEETALLTAESNENGVFEFQNVPYGDYLVRELSCPPAYVLSEEIIPVTVSGQEQGIKIEAVNRFVTGSVRVIKQDSENNAPISGVVFKVYADVDGNKEFDPEIDRLVGEPAETEAGIYQLDGLRYGGYFIREDAVREAYVRDDNCYYFAVQTDGETVTVGNDGEIFVNKPVLGSIRIRKTDNETGEALSGVVFGLFDVDGAEIRRGETDENGLLLFDNLRYGRYTIRELQAKDGYLLGTEPVEVEITEDGQLVEITLTNEKLPELPKTGVNSGLGFWIGLGAVALGGLLAALIVTIKQKKDEDDEV